MLKSTLTLLILLVLPLKITLAQDIKFGKVSKEELEEKYYPLDSSANAAILYKKRRTSYSYDDLDGWLLETKVHERIKIYNKEGYKWATKMISLYNGENGSESLSIKAYTFSLRNGKVEKIKLENNQIFNEEVSEYWNRKKITMPNLTERCIVDWEYTIYSPYYWNIDDMVFQYKIPIKHIDSEVIVPEYFNFKNQSQGYFPINIKRSVKGSSITINNKERSGGLGFGDPGVKTTYNRTKVDFTSNITNCIINNVPALIDEPYINNLNNYTTLLKFEINATKFPNSVPRYYNNTWEDVTKTIYKSPNFGSQLDKVSYFRDDLTALVNMTAPTQEKIDKIFQFVKSKIKWDLVQSKYTRDGVKKAYKEGVGNVAEINLTLVAMLREAGIKANPILVSTRDHGIPIFPTSEGFNYVIAGVEMDNNIILLDATESYSLPNVLPIRALNWQGRIVREDGSSASINLFPKTHSSKNVLLNVKFDQEALATGSFRATYNNLNALNYRRKYNSQNETDLIGKLEKENQNIEIVELKVINKENLYKPIVQNLKFESDNQAEIIGDNMYFSPLLFLVEKENPFKLDERKFPVDFGAPWEEKYTISIEIPEGYVIESKPENAGYTLPDNLGSYKYVSITKGNTLQVLSNVKINTPIISYNYYSSLKEFYKSMIDKQLEKVVLVKQ